MTVAVSRTSPHARAWSPAPEPAAKAHDRAVVCLEEAIRAVESSDTMARQRAVQQAIDAVTCLYLELGAEDRGESTKSLADFFGYIVGRVLRIDIFDDTRFAYQAMEILDVFYDSLSPSAAGRAPAVTPCKAATQRRRDTPAAVIPLDTTPR